MTMKTIPLTGKALELAKELATQYDNTVKRMHELDKQAMEERALAHKQMSMTVEAVKAELGLPADAHLHVDATYLKEHGVAYAQLHEAAHEEDGNPFQEFMSSSPPTLQ